MFRHKRLLLLFAVLVAACGSFLLPRPDARITPANCDKIREVMTKQEVEAILGPPGNYTSWPYAEPPFGRALWIPRCLDDEYWFGEEAFIVVTFYSEGRVLLAEIHSIASAYKDRSGRFMEWLRDLPERLAR